MLGRVGVSYDESIKTHTKLPDLSTVIAFAVGMVRQRDEFRDEYRNFFVGRENGLFNEPHIWLTNQTAEKTNWRGESSHGVISVQTGMSPSGGLNSLCLIPTNRSSIFHRILKTGVSEVMEGSEIRSGVSFVDCLSYHIKYD